MDLIVKDAGFKKLVLGGACLAVFWLWETWRPFVGGYQQRWRHGARNIFIAVLNTALMAVLYGAAMAAMLEITLQNKYGLLNSFGASYTLRFIAALLLLDAWTYFWHRANHFWSCLWAFHRMHHSDNQMDVTTATRFHLGELLLSGALRFGLIVLLGLRLEHLLVYDALVLAGTQFHHANVSLGGWDVVLRWLIVTPDMHKVHHSRELCETNSNYAVILSVWDRLFGTFVHQDPAKIRFGLDEFDDPSWQTVPGMLRTPLRKLKAMRRKGEPK